MHCPDSTCKLRVGDIIIQNKQVKRRGHNHPKMVAVARYGLIIWENEATGIRKVFRYLPDLRDTIKKSKNIDKVRKSGNLVIYLFFIYYIIYHLYYILELFNISEMCSPDRLRPPFAY